MCDFNRVLSGPDFGVWCVEELQYGVQGRRFAGTGWAADVKQAIWLADGRFQARLVVRCQAQFFQRNGLARRQDPHDHVFHATGRRNSGNPQFDIQRAVFLELDLAVLRLAALGDV